MKLACSLDLDVIISMKFSPFICIPSSRPEVPIIKSCSLRVCGCYLLLCVLFFVLFFLQNKLVARTKKFAKQKARYIVSQVEFQLPNVPNSMLYLTFLKQGGNNSQISQEPHDNPLCSEGS